MKNYILSAQKWQWREFADLYLRDACANLQIALKHMDQWLSDKTYLVGTEPTSIDADIFQLVYVPVARLSHQEREALPHLSRWCRLIQSAASHAPDRPPLVISCTRLYA